MKQLTDQFQALKATAQAKHFEYLEVKNKIIQYQQQQTRAHAEAVVTSAIEEIDEKCEEMASDFVYDDMEQKEFEEQFLKAREIFHRRSALLELQKS